MLIIDFPLPNEEMPVRDIAAFLSSVVSLCPNITSVQFDNVSPSVAGRSGFRAQPPRDVIRFPCSGDL